MPTSRTMPNTTAPMAVMLAMFTMFVMNACAAQTGQSQSHDLPLVGQPHNVASPEALALQLPEALAFSNGQQMRWTFFTGAGDLARSDRFAIWLNDELVYHNEIAPTNWMPTIRNFESDRIVAGMHRVRVVNTSTGEHAEHRFAAEETAHIVIFARPMQPLSIESFHYRVGYR